MLGYDTKFRRHHSREHDRAASRRKSYAAGRVPYRSDR